MLGPTTTILILTMPPSLKKAIIELESLWTSGTLWKYLMRTKTLAFSQERRSRYVTLPYKQNFWMTTNWKRDFKIKKWIPTVSNCFIYFVKCWRNFLRLNPKGPYLSQGKEKDVLCCVYLLHKVRERKIRNFHIAVLQRRLRNVQKRVMHVQSCCFAKYKPIAFLPFSMQISRSSRLRRGFQENILRY